MRSALQDKVFIQKLYIEPRVVEWVDRQPAEVKAKFRKAKQNALDEWWHRTEVFVAVTQVIAPTGCTHGPTITTLPLPCMAAS